MVLKDVGWNCFAWQAWIWLERSNRQVPWHFAIVTEPKIYYCNHWSRGLELLGNSLVESRWMCRLLLNRQSPSSRHGHFAVILKRMSKKQSPRWRHGRFAANSLADSGCFAYREMLLNCWINIRRSWEMRLETLSLRLGTLSLQVHWRLPSRRSPRRRHGRFFFCDQFFCSGV